MYILKNASGAIVGAGETPFIPDGGQTQEEIAGTLAEYAERFKLSVDRPIIAADGADEATVMVSMDPAPASVDIDVDGATETVTLSGGTGTLVITADVPGTIVVGPSDPTTYSPAGEGTLIITAEAA